MKHANLKHRNEKILSLAAIALVLMALASTGTAQTESVLFSFNYANGSFPIDGLVADSKGNLYGTTYYGGTNNSNNGVAFELSPPASQGGTWTQTVIWTFQGGADGANPEFTLAIDKAGNLYGITYAGGDSVCKCGTAYKLKPPATLGGAWAKKILHTFVGGNTDGANPCGGLILDSRGAVYGVTQNGGSIAAGTVFKIASVPGGRFAETILNDTIALPNGNLVFDSSGSLYGTDYYGGQGCGTVFQLSPTASGVGQWIYSDLYVFDSTNGGKSGCSPFSGLTIDSRGQLYGFTTACGAFGGGTFYRVKPPATAGGSWRGETLYAFTQAGGTRPFGKPLLDPMTSEFYGTALNDGAKGLGTVYKLVPPAVVGGAWTETVLHSFTGTPDGGDPFSSLIKDANGVLYGTTLFSGSTGYGTVFSVTP